MNGLRCTLDGVDVLPASATRGLMSWSETYQIALTQPHAVLEFRAIDDGLRQTVRVLHIYHSPDIIDQVFVSGSLSSQIQSHWAGEPARIIVALRQDVVGSYDITVGTALWDGTTYGAVTTVPYSTELTFPAAAGRYQYTVRAQDAVSGAGEDIVFPVYVQDVTTTNPWAPAATPGAYPHAVTGKSLTVSWGDLDTLVGPGLWIVEVKSDTLTRTVTTETSSSVAFSDVGEYLVRVGVRAQASASSLYIYTTYRSTGYIGTNTAPGTPVASIGSTAINRTLPLTLSFTVSATDADGDPLSYSIQSNLPVTISYAAASTTYSWNDFGDGTFGPTTPASGAWQFGWSIAAGTLTAGNPLTLSFTAFDAFGGFSAPLTLTFTVN
jgi:hypothetical protein